MNYGVVMKSTDHAPCTNIPIYCPVNNAPVTIWKYNAWIHLASEHGDLSKSDLPSKFMMDIFISKQEAKALGAADEDIVQEWRDTYKMPSSDDIQLSESAFVSNKRERVASSVVKEPKSKKDQSHSS